ncbi:MAG: PAS domain-containing protein [Pseudaminobacter sp.]|nr:PAS domain-containing protein [Pseudaminobacter sp.]
MDSKNDERREAERAQAKDGSGDPFAVAVASTRMPMLLTSIGHDDHHIVYANDAFLKLSGYSRDEVMGRNCLFLAGEDTDEADLAKLRDALNHGKDQVLEILNYRKDGTPLWNATFVGPVRDEAGKPTNALVSMIDLTEQKDAARQLQEANRRLQEANERLEAQVLERTRALSDAVEQKTVLLHEVDHRVKNNLQLISSLILLQVRRIPDPEIQRSLRAMLERISALSIVHRRLYQAEDIARFDVAEFIRDISSDLVGATGRDDIRIDLDLKPMVLSAAKAAPIALMLNEVLTNALKHAFPEERSGRIRILTKRLDNHFLMEIEDDGVGTDTSRNGEGFGMNVVNLLSRQLGAQVKRDTVNPGTLVRVTLPVGGVIPDEP